MNVQLQCVPHGFLIEIPQRPLQDAATVTGNNPTRSHGDITVDARLSTDVSLNQQKVKVITLLITLFCFQSNAVCSVKINQVCE